MSCRSSRRSNAIGSIVDNATEDATCWVNITTSGGSDRASWYDMWENLDAIDHMCARAGFTGKADSIGT